jgi:hypothetical protein
MSCHACEGVYRALAEAGDTKCDALSGGVYRLLHRAELAESRLLRLAAAAKEFREAEKRIAWTSAEQADDDVTRFHVAAAALDAQLADDGATKESR